MSKIQPKNFTKFTGAPRKHKIWLAEARTPRPKSDGPHLNTRMLSRLESDDHHLNEVLFSRHRFPRRGQTTRRMDKVESQGWDRSVKVNRMKITIIHLQKIL